MQKGSPAFVGREASLEDHHIPLIQFDPDDARLRETFKRYAALNPTFAAKDPARVTAPSDPVGMSTLENEYLTKDLHVAASTQSCPKTGDVFRASLILALADGHNLQRDHDFAANHYADDLSVVESNVWKMWARLAR